MAYAINTYTGDGTTDTFSVTFPYISTTDVVVTIDGVTKTLTTDYTFATSSTIQFTSPLRDQLLLNLQGQVIEQLD